MKLSKDRTITLTNRAPVTIREDLWPIIAQSSWCDDARVPQQSNRGCDIFVRQHEDGRVIVSARKWSRWQGERNWKGGELLDAGADLVAAIQRVGVECTDGCVRNCIASVPAQRLDDGPAKSQDAIDAARYRWLRREHNDPDSTIFVMDGEQPIELLGREHTGTPDLDVAIDAAMLLFGSES